MVAQDSTLKSEWQSRRESVVDSDIRHRNGESIGFLVLDVLVKRRNAVNTAANP